MNHTRKYLPYLFLVFIIQPLFISNASALSETTGDIYGNVYDTSSYNFSNPISGATVSVTGYSSATTDSSGYYSIKDVSPGSHEVVASATNYYPSTQYVYVYSNSPTSANFYLKPISTPTATPTPTPETGSIAGVVSDASTGSPISGAAVALDGPSNTTTTNSSGSYAFTGVSVASHTVVAAKTGYTQNTVPVSASDFVAVGGQLVATADIALTPPTPTPTPTPCEDATMIEAISDEINTFNELYLYAYYVDYATIIIKVTGEDGCPVMGDTVKAKIDNEGRNYISISPKKRVTDSSGEAKFEIKSKGKSKQGDAIVTFKDGSLRTQIYVHVE